MINIGTLLFIGLAVTASETLATLDAPTVVPAIQTQEDESHLIGKL